MQQTDIDILKEVLPLLMVIGPLHLNSTDVKSKIR